VGRRRDLLISYGLALALLVASGLIVSSGLQPGRILSILGQYAPLGIAAIGQTFVLLSGGLDLSVGPVINLSNIVASEVMDGRNERIPLAIAASLLAGVTVGLVNGLLVARARLNPLLTTLAVGTVVQGAYFVYTGGQPSGSIAPAFRVVANGRVPGVGVVPWSLVAWLLVWLLAAALLYRTVLGRRFYAVGANEKAAWLSGVPTTRYVVSAYVASAVCASLTGLLLSSYVGRASVGIGDAYTLNSIAAAVIGGTAFSGGVGGLAGTFAGAVVLAFLSTILNTLGIAQAAQLVAQGLVIAGMMLLYNRLLGRAR
jgi:ribose/xylose/arabinose/galactoside ABC-type transport system permease subunit